MMVSNMDVKIEGNALVIRIDFDHLATATFLSPAVEAHAYDDQGEERDIKITDKAVWAKEVCRELNRDAEDGTTLVHLMFDKAFEQAIEGGAEGIHIPGLDD